MAQGVASFDTAHGGALHDAQLDYYGKRLATASSDHTVRIWDVSSDQPQFLAELKGHEGPVWQVSWAHPKFGHMLATCSYDKRVLIWREQMPYNWQVIYRSEEHTASVNGVAFAPWELGLHLACASSDGTVSIHSHRPDNTWGRKSFQAHANGVTAVSWAPVGALATPGGQAMRIATGGCDNQVRVWRLDEASHDWVETHQMNDGGHIDWVRDVAWRPNVGLSVNVVASCSEDHTVILWQQESETSTWKNRQVLDFQAPVWRVSWSVTGTVLAVAYGDDEVALHKENVNGKWEQVANVTEESASLSPSAAETLGSEIPLRGTEEFDSMRGAAGGIVEGDPNALLGPPYGRNLPQPPTPTPSMGESPYGIPPVRTPGCPPLFGYETQQGKVLPHTNGAPLSSPFGAPPTMGGPGSHMPPTDAAGYVGGRVPPGVRPPMGGMAVPGAPSSSTSASPYGKPPPMNVPLPVGPTPPHWNR